MSEATSYTEIKMGAERSFGWVFCGVFLLITAFVYYKTASLNYWLLGISVTFGLITVFSPALLKPLNYLWFKFGMLLGHIIAPLVMMLIFFAVITPIGLLMRVFGKDSLRLKRNPELTTYWIERSKEVDSQSSMKNQF